jgi:hypothetical protein
MPSKKDSSWIASGLRAVEGAMAVEVETAYVSRWEEGRPADVTGGTEIENPDARG